MFTTILEYLFSSISDTSLNLYLDRKKKKEIKKRLSRLDNFIITTYGDEIYFHDVDRYIKQNKIFEKMIDANQSGKTENNTKKYLDDSIKEFKLVSSNVNQQKVFEDILTRFKNEVEFILQPQTLDQSTTHEINEIGKSKEEINHTIKKSEDNINRNVDKNYEKIKTLLEVTTENYDSTNKKTLDKPVTIIDLKFDDNFELRNFSDIKEIFKSYLESIPEERNTLEFNITDDPIEKIKDFKSTLKDSSDYTEEKKEELVNDFNLQIQASVSRNKTLSEALNIFLTNSLINFYVRPVTTFKIHTFINEVKKYMLQNFIRQTNVTKFDFVYSQANYFVAILPDSITKNFSEEQRILMYQCGLDIIDFNNIDMMPIIVALSIHLADKKIKEITINNKEYQLGYYTIGLH